MSDLAAHLVDEVLPEVPIRQWVCSLPWSLRYALAYDRALCADVLDAFLGALTRSLRRRAKRELGLRSVEDARAGAVTFVQRSDGSLRINPHFHTLALDGVYVRGEDGALAFHALGAPSGEHVAQVAAWTHAAIVRVLERHGRSLDGVSDAPDPIAEEQPVLASCYGASAADVQLLGAAPGQKTTKLVHPVRVVPSPTEALAEVGGVNVHAKVVIDGRDRKRLEGLCRYVARPPLSQERLELHGDGRVRYRFKAAWKDGTHAVLLDPLDFIARLCALIPKVPAHYDRFGTRRGDRDRNAARASLRRDGARGDVFQEGSRERTPLRGRRAPAGGGAVASAGLDRSRRARGRAGGWRPGGRGGHRGAAQTGLRGGSLQKS